LYRISLIFALMVASAGAQNWSTFLDPSRATDWSTAGFTIPTYTVNCATQPSLATGSGAAAANTTSIQAALNSCDATHNVVNIPAGTYFVAGLTYGTQGKQVLRGSSPNSTDLLFTAEASCAGVNHGICMIDGSPTFNGSPTVAPPSGTQQCLWTGGLTQGSTSITLSSCGGTPPVNHMLILDQANDTSDTSGVYICDTNISDCGYENPTGGGGNNDGRTVSGVTHSQQQVAFITGVTSLGGGSYTVTLSQGVYFSNVRTGQNAGAWWSGVVQNDGLENLTIDGTSIANGNVEFYDCYQCWVKNVRSLNAARNHIEFSQSADDVVRDSYLYQSQSHATTSYGIEFEEASAVLVENNIFQQVTNPIMFGQGSGNVMSYNFSINQPTTSLFSPQTSYDSHNAGNEMNLWEGNNFLGIWTDDAWGSSTQGTYFRNMLNGWQGGGYSTNFQPLQIRTWIRGMNVVGNVMGTAGIQNQYQAVATSSSGGTGAPDAGTSIYELGWSDDGGTGVCATISCDPLVGTTLMRWGNYDTVNAATQWNTTEAAPAAVTFMNANFTTSYFSSLAHTLPASLHYNATPSWWPTGKAWPPVGPDVSSGNVGTCSGGTYAGYQATSSSQCTGGTLASAWASHVTSNPAQDYYLNVMLGPPDGTGSVLSFDRAVVNTTWFIRHDGGTNTQCTGTTNAAYPGTGSAQPCAYNHPFQMLNSAGNFTAMIGGDTIQFADPPTNTTPYFMGEQNNGVGTDWSSQIPSMCPSPNTDGVDCVMPAFPSGTSTAHTKIIGQNAGSCHTLTPNPGLVTPTLLSGINDAFRVFNLQGTDFVDISCIAIVQPDTCTLSGPASNPIDFTSLSGGVASYIWHNTGVGNLPLNSQNVTITGTTNDGGALNLVGAQITSVSPSTLNITQDQVTSTTTAVLTYTVASGEAPIVGQTGFSITGLTSGGGQLNTSFGNGTISAVTGTTSGTFTITASSPTWTVTAPQSETGTFTNFVSGTFTVALTGSAAKQAETGTQVATGSCTQSNNYARTGINFELDVAQGPSNYTLTDVAMVGLASRGTLGGAINTLSTDVSSESYVFILGNGFTGKDGDGGGCDTSCEDVGTVNVDHEYIEWNGCVAKTKNPVYGGNTVDLCYGQGSGGQGDGWVAIAAGNVTFNITNSFARYNTQDGFDLLHLSDDLTTSPIVNISKSRSEGNLGQTFKIGAGASATAINNVSVANCAFITTASNFPTFPSSFAAGIPPAGITGIVNADVCRADGDQWALNLKSGATVTIENNTSVGYGATAYDFELGGGATTCTSCTVIFKNNITKGYNSPVTGIEAAGVFIGSGVSPSFFTSSNNNWNTIRTGCPDPTLNDTSGVQCGDPNLVSESNVNAINPNITAASTNVLHLGTPISGITTDFNGTARPNPPSIGAFEPQPTTIQPPIQLTGKITISGKIQLQ
jgi:hypothetical protein